MTVRYLIPLFIGCLIFSNQLFAAESAPVDYVDPFIGVLDKHSNCVIGPQLPFASINPSPQTPNGGHDGYHPERPIRGFGQLHVSGTGWGKYGNFLLSPQIGLSTAAEGHDSEKSQEVAKPYAYSVYLDRYAIGVAFAPTAHCVLYTFTYPESEEASLVFDITHNIPQHIAKIGGRVRQSSVTLTPDGQMIRGEGIFSGGFGSGSHKLYFVAKWDTPATRFGTWHEDTINEGSMTASADNNERLGAFLQFKTTANQTVQLKLGISFHSHERALSYLDAEIPRWERHEIESQGRKLWNDQLSKIRVETDNTEDKIIFYSALYRTLLMPRNRTGEHRKFPEGAPMWDDHYAVWDTWRTVFPLHVLINPQMVRDVVDSFITRQKINGVVKDAFIAGIDMRKEQGGNNISNIVADAVLKEVPGIDIEAAYALIRNQAEEGRQGIQRGKKQDTAPYLAQGWIPAGIMSTSITQEYAYNDYSAALVAQKLGHHQDAEKYFARSHQWPALWNPDLEDEGFKGFIDGRNADGTFVNIDPRKYSGSWKPIFYEANAWTYSFFAPHDMERLIELQGGKETFIKRLEHAIANKRIIVGNEPAFLVTRAFHHASRPDLSSYHTHKLMDELYDLQGYPGNEDSGAMGSWYVFSALGIFPNAGQTFYYLTAPTVNQATIQLGNGNTLTIQTDRSSKDDVYVKSCLLNGKPVDTPYLEHEQIMAGGTLVFELSPLPTDWGRQ